MSEDTSPAPMIHVVRRLRELMAKAAPPPWKAHKSDGTICMTSIGHQLRSAEFCDGDDAALASEAVNHLPALLAIVEAANDCVECEGKYGLEQQAQHSLRRALASLPNPKADPAAVVGGSGPASCWTEGQ